MKIIHIKNGHQAIVDDDMFEELSKYAWGVITDSTGRRIQEREQLLNHLILHNTAVENGK